MRWWRRQYGADPWHLLGLLACFAVAAYAITRQCLLDQQVLLGQQSGAVVIPEELVSIDTLADFEAVERALAERDTVGREQ